MITKELRKRVFLELLDHFARLHKKERGAQRKMAQSFNVSDAAIKKWKDNGIPDVRIPFCLLRFPNLNVWSSFSSEEKEKMTLNQH